MSLDIYDPKPTEMKAYLRNYGWNFNKKSCMLAVSMMTRKNSTSGKEEHLEAKSKDEVDSILAKHDIKLPHNKGYNYIYAYHMGLADMYKSSLEDEAHLAKFVRDCIEDHDMPGGNLFRHWYSDMVKKEIPIEWEEIL